MKKSVFYTMVVAFFLFVAFSGGYVWTLFAPALYFRSCENVDIETYPNGLIRHIQLRGEVTEEDVAHLRPLRFRCFYPIRMEINYANFIMISHENTTWRSPLEPCVTTSKTSCDKGFSKRDELDNVTPLPRIPAMDTLVVIGSSLSETSWRNLLGGRGLKSLTILETVLPQNLIDSAPHYALESVWLDEVPLSDDNFDKLFSLQKTETLVLVSLPITQKTIQKICREGDHLREILLMNIPISEEDLKSLKSLKSLRDLKVKTMSLDLKLRRTSSGIWQNHPL